MYLDRIPESPEIKDLDILLEGNEVYSKNLLTRQATYFIEESLNMRI